MRHGSVFLLIGVMFLSLAAQETPATQTDEQEPGTAGEATPEQNPETPAAETTPPTPSIEKRLNALEERARKAEATQSRLEAENRALTERLGAQDEAKKEQAQIPAGEPKKKAVEFHPYGFIELLGWANDALFVGNDLTLYVSDKGRSTVGMTAKGSRLGTKVTFPRIEEVVLTAVAEIDFVANMADTGFAESYPMLRMRHAYFELTKTWENSTLGFKAGQTWATATPTIWPALLNPAAGWAMGNTWQRMPLIEFSFTQKFADTFSFTAQLAAARAMSGASANRNGFLEINIDAGDATHIPQIQGQLSLKGSFSDIDLFVAASGAWGRESYKSGVYLNNKKDTKYIGGIVDVGMVTGALKLSHKYAEIAGKFWWGQNLDVFGVFGGSLITETVDTTTKRVLDSQRALGWWAQLTMKPLAGLALNVGYGAEDPEEGQKGAAPLYYENDALWVSAFYTFFERVTIGFQWIQLQTKDLLRPSGSRISQTGNNLMGQLKVSF